MQEAGESPLRLLKRHAHGDWGDLHEDDVRANELAIRRGMRVLSAYVLTTDERVWIITEADRSATTILRRRNTDAPLRHAGHPTRWTAIIDAMMVAGIPRDDLSHAGDHRRCPAPQQRFTRRRGRRGR